MTEVKLVVKHAVGLHARPAAKFSKIAKEFESQISLENLTRGGAIVDAKSLVKVIKVAAAQSHEIKIIADGPDEYDAIRKLKNFIEDVPQEEQ